MTTDDRARLWVYAQELRLAQKAAGIKQDKLTGNHMLVLDKLLFLYHNAVDGACFPSYDSLMEETGLARDTIRRSLNVLRANHLIDWDRRIRRIKKTIDGVLKEVLEQWSNAYRFFVPQETDFRSRTQPSFNQDQQKRRARRGVAALLARVLPTGRRRETMAVSDVASSVVARIREVAGLEVAEPPVAAKPAGVSLLVWEVQQTEKAVGKECISEIDAMIKNSLATEATQEAAQVAADAERMARQERERDRLVASIAARDAAKKRPTADPDDLTQVPADALVREWRALDDPDDETDDPTRLAALTAEMVRRGIALPD